MSITLKPGARLFSCVCSTEMIAVKAPAGEVDITIGGVLPDAANSVNAVTGTVLVKEDTTFDPTGDAAGKLVAGLKSSPINPRPRVTFPSLPIGGCPAPAGDFVDPGATYHGAFASGAATQLWTDRWTVLSQGGLLD